MIGRPSKPNMNRLETGIELAARLLKVNTEMAEQIKIVRLMMVGKGISPAESPLVQTRLLDIEHKLRMIGSNPANLIPFDN